MTCPSCQQKMHVHERSGIPVAQCEGCRGIFLHRSTLADLVDSENSWHANAGQYTQPLPRITSDMTAPPKASGGQAKRSFLDILFG
jgi:Zn-finger nucleic acid-binding protein